MPQKKKKISQKKIMIKLLIIILKLVIPKILNILNKNNYNK